MNAYFLDEIETLRSSPEDHLLSRLVHVETEEGHLTDEELLSFCRLLLIAGNETTTGLITASARIFHEMPDTFTAIGASPALATSFVEEALRFYSPLAQPLVERPSPLRLVVNPSALESYYSFDCLGQS